MNHLPFICLISLFYAAAAPHSGIDQNEIFRIKGRLLDARTMKPIENAHIFWASSQAISDEEGEFSIPVKENTLLTITHISYEQKTYLINDENDSPITVYLLPATLELEEVTIGTLPDEQTFKQQVLAAKPPFHLQNQLLKSNLQFMTNIHHLAYHYDMNSYDKLLSNLNNKGATVLFSTNPQMGIMGLIRRLKQKPVLPKKTRVPIK